MKFHHFSLSLALGTTSLATVAALRGIANTQQGQQGNDVTPTARVLSSTQDVYIRNVGKGGVWLADSAAASGGDSSLGGIEWPSSESDILVFESDLSGLTGSFAGPWTVETVDGYVAFKNRADLYLCMADDSLEVGMFPILSASLGSYPNCHWEREAVVSNYGPCPDDGAISLFLIHLFWSSLDDGDSPTNVSDMLNSASWDEYESNWSELHDTIKSCYRYDVLKDGSSVLSVETTTASGETNYARALLSEDELGRPWVIFPGATGDQERFGWEGGYTRFRDGGGFVHDNFYTAWQAMKTDVENFVTSNNSGDGIVIAGHSMGGLHAILSSFEMQDEGLVSASDINLFLWGAPNPGDYQASSTINNAVGSYGRAKWYTGYIQLNCNSQKDNDNYCWQDEYGDKKCAEKTIYLRDIISYAVFKLFTYDCSFSFPAAYHCDSTLENGYETDTKYYPRGLSTQQAFYWPHSSSSNFDHTYLREDTQNCNQWDALGFPWTNKDVSRDLTTMKKAQAHMTSYYLSGVQNMDYSEPGNDGY